MTTFTTTIDSPVGPLLLTSDGTALTRLLFDAPVDPSWSTEPCPVLDRATAQLAEYFAGERTDVRPAAGADRHAVPASDLAGAARDPLRARPSTTASSRCGSGNPKASRAVGLANGRNPISIVVPCHRVIGADGSLTGYGGGLDRKRLLLDLERRVAGAEDPQLSLL